MLKLVKLGTDEFVILSGKNRAIYGNTFRIIYSLKAIGVELVEIEAALNELVVNDNDAAEFGVNLTFIYAHKFSKTG